mmetsp:Transcript_11935/g.34364  ORF Transcript_11935/g.34364 Transcript_11935/m.34364 type:complete len:214 (+) Transcript_11935:76-717(+)
MSRWQCTVAKAKMMYIACPKRVAKESGCSVKPGSRKAMEKIVNSDLAKEPKGVSSCTSKAGKLHPVTTSNIVRPRAQLSRQRGKDRRPVAAQRSGAWAELAKPSSLQWLCRLTWPTTREPTVTHTNAAKPKPWFVLSSTLGDPTPCGVVEPSLKTSPKSSVVASAALMNWMTKTSTNEYLPNWSSASKAAPRMKRGRTFGGSSQESTIIPNFM